MNIEDHQYMLYLLQNDVNGRTYLGVTNNINRRLRQHNGIIKGGAKYTTAFKSTGKWILRAFVDKLTKHDAYSYEKLIKHKKIFGYERKIALMKSVTNRDVENIEN